MKDETGIMMLSKILTAFSLSKETVAMGTLLLEFKVSLID
jgi:hypothetical protein